MFGFATYLIARGAYSRRALHLAAGLVVLVVYGSTLLFGLVPTPGVSWQGHAFGAIGVESRRGCSARGSQSQHAYA